MRPMRPLAIVATANLAISCGQGANAGDPGDPPPGWGQISVGLSTTAAAPPVILNVMPAGTYAVQAKEVVVTVDRVTAYAASVGWVTLWAGTKTLDILKLQDEAATIGITNLPAGRVTQIRFYTAASGPQYVTLKNDTRVDLVIPGGYEAGVKISGPFDVAECNRLAVALDFAVHKAVWVHPSGVDTWTLRPIIRVKDTLISPGKCAPPDASACPSPDSQGCAPAVTSPASGGAACAVASSCLSGACASGKCAPGGPGAPCNQSGDCVSSACQSSGTCDPRGGIEAGGPCAASSTCMSGVCTSGACEAGGQGALCGAPASCAIGFKCTNTTCVPDVG